MVVEAPLECSSRDDGKDGGLESPIHMGMGMLRQSSFEQAAEYLEVVKSHSVSVRSFLIGNDEGDYNFPTMLSDEMNKVNDFFELQLSRCSDQISLLVNNAESDHIHVDKASRGSLNAYEKSRIQSISTQRIDSLSVSFKMVYSELKKLESYRSFNLTICTKLMMKHDKYFKSHRDIDKVYPRMFLENPQWQISTDSVLKMIQRLENEYAKLFCKDNVLLAEGKLNFEKGNASLSYIYLLGLKLGICLTLLTTLVVITARDNTIWTDKQTFMYMFLGNIIFYRWTWIICITSWRAANISYQSLLELHGNYQMTSEYMISEASSVTVIYLSCFLEHARQATGAAPLIPQLDSDLIIMILYAAAALMFFIQNVMYRQRRRGLFSYWILFKIFTAPFWAVTFRDNIAANYLTSFMKVITNGVLASCYVVTGSFREMSNNDICISPKIISVASIVGFLPLVFRFMQTSRRASDIGGTDAAPESWILTMHTYDSMKYSFSIVIAVVALFVPYGTFSDSHIIAKVVILFFAFAETIFQTWWDSVVDFGLLNNMPYYDKDEQKMIYPKNMFLRPKLLFRSQSYYYMVLIVNFFLRFLWMVSLFPQSFLGYSNTLHVLLSFAELTRRCLWSQLRVEWEHIVRAGPGLGHTVSIYIERSEWNTATQSFSSSRYSILHLLGHIFLGSSLLLIIFLLQAVSVI